MRLLCAACLAFAAPACTIELPSEERALPIIGGEIASALEFPATGALVIADRVSCSGTLIAPTVVLTAAHCLHSYYVGDEVPGFTLVSDASGSDIDVVAGLSSHPHPLFDPEIYSKMGVQRWNDIGVLLLSDAIRDVEPAILWQPQRFPGEPWVAAESSLQIVGYGVHQLDSNDFAVKRKGQATLREMGAHEIWVSEDDEMQSCYGDSGGSTYATLDTLRLVGVISRPPDQNPVCDHGSISTRVDAYLDWIQSFASELSPATSTEPVAIDWESGETDTGGCQSAGSERPAGSWALLLALFALLRGAGRFQRSLI